MVELRSPEQQAIAYGRREEDMHLYQGEDDGDDETFFFDLKNLTSLCRHCLMQTYLRMYPPQPSDIVVVNPVLKIVLAQVMEKQIGAGGGDGGGGRDAEGENEGEPGKMFSCIQ